MLLGAGPTKHSGAISAERLSCKFVLLVDRGLIVVL